DTYIGANDGVPFTIPGAAGLCDTQATFDGDRVPDFIQALEHDNLSNPGTVAHVQFRLGGAVEPPGKVMLGAWPNESFADFGHPAAGGGLPMRTVPQLDIAALKGIAEDLARRAPPARKRDAERLARTTPPDSAVTAYWGEADLPAGGRREVGLAYGLGDVA